MKGDKVMVTSDGDEVNVKGDEDNIVMTRDADGVTMQCGDFVVKVQGGKVTSDVLKPKS